LVNSKSRTTVRVSYYGSTVLWLVTSFFLVIRRFNRLDGHSKQHGMALTGADGSRMAAADEGAIAAAAAAAAALEQQEFVDMNPKTALSSGVKRTTYAAWFSRPGWAQEGEFWQLELSAPQLRAVQRLRLGSHSLPVETSRFAQIDRQDRCCTFCDSGAVLDEKNLLMECPATGVVRQRFSCLFDLAVPPCMRQLVWGGDNMMVAEFMLACLGEVGLIGSSAH